MIKAIKRGARYFVGSFEEFVEFLAFMVTALSLLFFSFGIVIGLGLALVFGIRSLLV